MAKQVATTAKAAPATPRGAVTAARWAACGKGKTGFAVTLPAHVKALSPATTVITCNVAQNPKRNAVNPFIYPFASAAGVTGIAPGNTCTLAAYIAAITKANQGGATQAAEHVAWDVNHDYITLSQAPQA